MTKVVKHNSTIGMRAYIDDLNGYKFVRIAYDRLEDNTFKVYVENAETLQVQKKLGIKILSNEQIEDLVDTDPYDNVRDFINLGKLFGITI